MKWPWVGCLGGSIDLAIGQRINMGIGIYTHNSASSLTGSTRVTGNPSTLE